MLIKMKCPICSNDMVESKAGWMCLQCGHMEIAKEDHHAKITFDTHPKPAISTKPPEVLGMPVPSPRIADRGANTPEPDPEAIVQTPPKYSLSRAPHQPPTSSAPEPPLENNTAQAAATVTDPLIGSESAPSKYVADSEPVASSAVPNQPANNSSDEIGLVAADEPSESLEPQTALSSSPAVAAAIAAQTDVPSVPPTAVSTDVSADQPVQQVDPDREQNPIAQPEPELEPTPEPKPIPQPDPDPMPEPEPEPQLEPQLEPEPQPEPTSEPVKDSAPTSDPLPDTLVAAAAIADKITPDSAPPPPVSEPPPVAADSKPTPPSDVNSNKARTAKDSKPPLRPVTHPKPISNKTAILAIIAAILLAVFGGVAAYAFVNQPSLFSWLIRAKPQHSMPMPRPTVAATPTPEASIAVSPAPEPSASPADQNPQRIASLAAYKAAFLATAKNGYFSVTPPAVQVNATEPSTGKAFEVITTVPTAVWQVRYWAGGTCSGQTKTPGTNGTKYLALQILLEGNTTPYCVEVK